MDYKNTLNMPKSGFPMRAGLPKREPEMLKHWEEMDLYNLMLKERGQAPLRPARWPSVLQRRIAHGSRAQQVPEGLHHPFLRDARLLHALYPRLGQPRHAHRERHHQAEQAQPQGHARFEFRSACHEFAQHYIDVQMEGFKRIGVLGDWEHPTRPWTPASRLRRSRSSARCTRRATSTRA